MEFDSEPYQNKPPRETKFSVQENKIVRLEVDKLLKIGVITKSENCHGEFISTIFTRSKKDDSHRLILNQFITYHHFEMELLQCALQLVKPNCWMAVIDLRDAF